MGFTRDKKIHILKGLTALSKFLGIYPQFRYRTQAFGIKWELPSPLETFNHMLKKNNQNVFDWAKKVMVELPMHKEYLQFAELSGLRKTECIQSYNLIIELAYENRLDEYYNASDSCLEHFKFPELFVRRTKNAYISFIPRRLIEMITKSHRVTYEMIRKKLQRRGFRIKLSLLRSAWATFMEKRLSQAEVDLLQGRVSQSVFMRYYFAPDLKQLKLKVLTAVKELERLYE